ncbi:sensor histidine kinase [Myroides odoratus]|uniref:Inner membrane protein ypdA n=1 Tax=Myroides odoratus TaxID=256 RepID=A0A378RI22_MYROD|nr:histidine kinase [Myroides odoratus]MCS4240118.1 sensor histidine kinase YesM [Myroides odoratus]MDH6601134.1 two-component system LytT family sensor kinase [Myroides gitamensis]QQU02402.1 histidine kinase [Myroides odoratus]STZ26652.1 Inner membrane protein ypdA [Myroides odoratus]
MERKVEKNNIDQSLFTKHYRLVVIPAVFVLYLFSHFLLNPYDPEWYNSIDTDSFWQSGIMILVYCTLISEISLRLSHALNKVLPWTKYASWRVVVQLLLLILLIFLVYCILNIAYLVWIPYEPGEILDLEAKIDIWQSLLISINTGIFISVIHTGYFLIKNWKNSMMDAAELKLKAEQLERIASQAELETLKMQLDPHFLFNNFSTLSELVIEDQQVAVKFIDHLALVYRYMLSNVRKNSISLKEEISFVESYFYLIKERMGRKVELIIDIPENVQNTQAVAPIALQLLVENAVKHNTASKEHPLVIHIEVVNQYVVVRNNLQKLVVELPSSKVGLDNIVDRYRLLSQLDVEITSTTEEFIVKLPLLAVRERSYTN